MMHPRVSVEFTDVGVTYANGVVALAGLSLTIAPNQAVCVVGPSGCGKTTLLRLLAGLEQPSRGQVTMATPLRMAMVFQQGLLFPWLSVADNISYGLMTQGAPPVNAAVWLVNGVSAWGCNASLTPIHTNSRVVCNSVWAWHGHWP